MQNNMKIFQLICFICCFNYEIYRRFTNEQVLYSVYIRVIVNMIYGMILSDSKANIYKLRVFKHDDTLIIIAWDSRFVQ